MDLKEQYEKLLRYCYMLTGNRNIAEDIVQETYLRFWQSRSYHDNGKELAYLYVIARNLCMDEFRRVRTLAIDDCCEYPGDAKYEPDSQTDRIAVEKALEKLPNELRELLVLRYADEMNVTDIAKIVGLSRFSVHRRLKEGLGMLKEMLGGDMNDK